MKGLLVAINIFSVFHLSGWWVGVGVGAWSFLVKLLVLKLSSKLTNIFFTLEFKMNLKNSCSEQKGKDCYWLGVEGGFLGSFFLFMIVHLCAQNAGITLLVITLISGIWGFWSSVLCGFYQHSILHWAWSFWKSR